MRPVTRRLSLTLLGAILALHVLLGLGFGLNTPLFESPDEPGHYLFVRYLQAYGRLPVQTADFMSPRGHHPPLYYLMAAALTSWANVPGSPDAIHMPVNPKFGFRAGDPGNDNKAFGSCRLRGEALLNGSAMVKPVLLPARSGAL